MRRGYRAAANSVAVREELVALAGLLPQEPWKGVGKSVLGVDAENIAGKGFVLAAKADPDEPRLGPLIGKAETVAMFLKALGHDGRLTILCHLLSGPKSVTELENLLSSRQAVVSQQLARLRLEGLVQARREGQAIFYSLLDPKVSEMIALLARLFDETSRDTD